jgi:hypothetical protein
MADVKAFYDVAQDTITAVGKIGDIRLEIILINRKSSRQVVADSLSDQNNCYGFVPPHLRVIQLKHFNGQSNINFVEDPNTIIQASYQYSNLIRDN